MSYCILIEAGCYTNTPILTYVPTNKAYINLIAHYNNNEDYSDVLFDSISPTNFPAFVVAEIDNELDDDCNYTGNQFVSLNSISLKEANTIIQDSLSKKEPSLKKEVERAIEKGHNERNCNAWVTARSNY